MRSEALTSGEGVLVFAERSGSLLDWGCYKTIFSLSNLTLRTLTLWLAHLLLAAWKP
jgi:hypothetical protein